MEVILSYLENMFLHLPKTPEVQRAKEELAAMMEDKYNELLAEGKKENEAVGIVISEFGDLSELAEELGLHTTDAGDNAGEPQNNACAQNKTEARSVSRSEAEEYITMSTATSKWIAFGVALCICCPIPVVLCGGVDGAIRSLTDAQKVCMGLIPLFVMVGIAVAIFIYNGMKMERFEYLKKVPIQIDAVFKNELRERQEQERPGHTVKIIAGVLLCIFAVIPVLVTSSMTDNDMVSAVAVSLLLFVVSIAVWLFISGGSKMESIKVLLQEGDFTCEKKENDKIINVIAGIYWPIVTLIYLGWSFVTMHWGFTWIVWPIAGVLFGVISTICGAVSQTVQKN